MEDKEIQEEISAFRRRLLESVRAIKVFDPENKAQTYENGFRNGNNSGIDLALGHIEKKIEELEQKFTREEFDTMTTNDEIYEKYMGKPFTLEDLAEGRIGKAVNDMLNSVRQDEREKKGSSLLTDVADHIADNSMVAEIGKQIIQARSDTAKQIKESLDKDFNVPILLNTQFRSRMEYIFKGLLEGKITEKEYNEYFKQYEVEYEKKKVEYQSFWSKILKE